MPPVSNASPSSGRNSTASGRQTRCSSGLAITANTVSGGASIVISRSVRTRPQDRVRQMDARELVHLPTDQLCAEARLPAARRLVTLLAEGLHPADDALPRRLRLLHVRAAAAARRARVPEHRRGARDRARRRRRRLPRGALHARRQAGAPLPRRARGARGARLRDDARVPRPRGAGGARGDRAAAAPQSGRDEPRRARRAPRGERLDGDHARDRLRPALGEGDAALRLARQAAGAPARDDRRSPASSRSRSRPGS